MASGTFVGRRAELGQIQAALTEARSGAGAMVLVAGEAGIGKTRLAEEVARTAAWQGVPAVWGPAPEGDATPPYWMWRQVLSSLSRTATGTVFPEPARLDSALSPFSLYETVLKALTAGAGPEGLLVVLDDLHWGDPGSLRLLQIAAAQLPGTRILILGTHRQPEATDDTPFAEVLPALLRERAVSRIRLRGLEHDETGSLLEQILDQPPEAGLVNRLHEQTDGSPFLLVELAAEIRAMGTRARLPDSLRGIARRRLRLVGESCRRTLASAAVIGRDFDLGTLAAAAGADPDRLLNQLAEAAAAGLIEETGPHRHRFAHALLREALYLELTARERTEAHLRVARAIAGFGAAERHAHTDALAHHLRRALPNSDPKEALAATVAAAESAAGELAFEHAADRYREAVEILERWPDASHSRARLLLSLARCHQRAGAVAAAWEASQAAAAASRQAGDTRTLAEAALVVRGMLDPKTSGPLRALCEDALTDLELTEVVLRARLLAQISLAAAVAGDSDAASLAGQALEAARLSADPDARLLALQAKEWEITGVPELARLRLDLSLEAVEVAHQSPDPGQAVWAHSWRLGASWELGLRARADAELASLAVAVDRLKEPLARWRLELARGTLALIDGRYGDAVEAAARAATIARRGGQESAITIALVLRHLSAARTGDSSAEDELRELAGGHYRLWYATYLADQGRTEELRQLWAGGPEAVPVVATDMWLIIASAEAKLAAALGNRDWALRAYERLAPFPELHVVRGPLGGYDGPVALYAGQAAAVIGRSQEAEQLFRKALAGAGLIGSPPFEALARYHLARLLKSRGSARDVGTASTLLEQAGTAAERLGMVPLARWAAADLELVRHPRGRSTMLSNRELEIAGLVAEGLTNRAIGERLHLSERTAENHVKNILDKLGFDSRAQIAAWAAAR